VCRLLLTTGPSVARSKAVAMAGQTSQVAMAIKGAPKGSFQGYFQALIFPRYPVSESPPKQSYRKEHKATIRYDFAYAQNSPFRKIV